MKPFNLALALTGDKVVTRDGNMVDILGYDNTENESHPLLVQSKSFLGITNDKYTKEGKYISFMDSNMDLFMEESEDSSNMNVVDIKSDLSKNRDFLEHVKRQEIEKLGFRIFKMELTVSTLTEKLDALSEKIDEKIDEEKEVEMYPFDLERMIAGSPIICRNGVTPTQASYFSTVCCDYNPICCVINGEIETFSNKGRYFSNGIDEDHELDLFMKNNEG